MRYESARCHRRLRLGLAIALIAAGGVACGESIGPVFVTSDTDVSVDSVLVQPPTALVTELGATVEFEARPLDATGAPVEATSATWRSSDLTVATIGQDGVARAVGEGQTEITATFGQQSGSAFLTVSRLLVPDPQP